MEVLKFFTLLYSTLLYSTLLYSTLLYSTLLYSTLLYSTLLYSTLQGRAITTCILYEINYYYQYYDHLCSIVVRVPGYRSRGPDSIPAPIRFSEK
jgi:hypothetical protein